ncbi:MAG: beta-lactamase family protein [Gammaproteobacteria bacterium]|nr:beta-lactamase family protein [Gammaproteobacteria bacterium]
MFTHQDINKINKAIFAFPVGAQFSVAIIKNGAAYYYGGIKAKSKIKEITNEHSIFEVGSITKVFTSAVLAQMAVENLIDINEEISPKLGFTLKDNIKITYKELSTHSSGLPGLPLDFILGLLFRNKENPYRDYSEERLIKYLKYDLKLKMKASLRYSNVGVGLLGYVLSKVSGCSFDEILKQRIFTPLQMFESTTIRKEIEDKLIVGLNKKGKPTKNWDLNILAGAGGMLSSTYDLSKFIISNVEGNSKAVEFQKQCFYEKGKHSMGLGWFILKNQIPNINAAYFHNGGTGGYRSSMVVDFEKGNGVIVLTNVSGLYLLKGEKIDKLAFKLLENINKKHNELG